MKTIYILSVFKKPLMVAFAGAVLLTVSCKKEPQPTVNCSYKGSFVYKQGVNGFYGPYYILSEGNEIFVPCDAAPNLINTADIYDGMPVTFDYKTIADEAPCGSCREISSYPSSPRFVKITCVSENKTKSGRCGTEW